MCAPGIANPAAAVPRRGSGQVFCRLREAPLFDGWLAGCWRIFAEPNSGRESERWCGRRVSFITVNERRWFTHEYSGQCRRRSVHRRRSR